MTAMNIALHPPPWDYTQLTPICISGKQYVTAGDTGGGHSGLFHDEDDVIAMVGSTGAGTARSNVSLATHAKRVRMHCYIIWKIVFM